MSKTLKLVLGLTAAMFAHSVMAKEGTSPVPGVTRLNHVYLIVMENHGYSQIIGNPNAPFTNAWAKAANLATNFFAVGHPSLTNYLEIVGGSNFGVRNDNAPDWHNASCQTSLATGVAQTDNPATGPVCPIAGIGTDAATPAVDCTNEFTGPACGNDIDGVKGYSAAANIDGKTIADQLVAAHLTVRTYQESLPGVGADRVEYSDGLFSNLTDFTKIKPTLTPPLTSSNIAKLYAAKHNPFVYFANVQAGTGSIPYSEMRPFDGPTGLWANFESGRSPSLSLIVPNQCNDQHGRGNAGPFCNFDPTSDGTQAGLNPALIQLGDLALGKIVRAIKASPSWSVGKSAIIAVWDENDYSTQPNINQVPLIVDTNFGAHPVTSATYYNHFSLLKTIEGALGLPCLNHACDAATVVMSDLIGR